LKVLRFSTNFWIVEAETGKKVYIFIFNLSAFSPIFFTIIKMYNFLPVSPTKIQIFEELSKSLKMKSVPILN
jgi:hypothetical protein